MHARSAALVAAAPLALAACSSAAPAGALRDVAVHVTPLAAPPAEPAGGALAEAVRAAVSQAPDDGEIVVTAPRPASESELVGPYGQPEWTTRRRFARTRLYVLPEGQIEFEQWWRGTFDRGEAAEHRFQTEVGIGLPGRLQFDVYGNVDHGDGRTTWTGLQPELRWAPADWGVLPLNPTLYLEYKWNHHDQDVAEAKILLGDQIAPCVHWGMNLSVEQQLGGDREQELAVTQAISWTLADRQFGVGIEFEADRITAAGSRDDAAWEFYAGPSLQWRPTEDVHVDLVPLRGWHDAHDWRVFLVVGYDFGGRSASGPRAPTSSKSR